MTEPIGVRLQAVRQRGPRMCSVRGCGKVSFRVGSRCRRHAARYERSGHPEGRALPRTVWQPLRDEAEVFINDRLEHRGIANALAWLASLIRSAAPPRRITKRSRPQDRLAVYLGAMRDRGVNPVRLLSTIVAIHAARQADDRAFRSDKQFWHAVASAFLSTSPRPLAGRWRQDGRPATVAPSARLLEHTGRLLTTTLGVLSERIGDEVNKRVHLPRPIAGQDIDFINPNPTHDSQQKEIQ